MESIKINLLSLSDTDRLFEFEKENRKYFESIGLSRVDKSKGKCSGKKGRQSRLS